MAADLSKTVSGMEDLRRTQRDVRRTAAILRWPTYLLSALFLAVWTAAWMGGFRNPLVDVGFLITLLILVIPWLLFHKRILRAFLGGRTPLILAKRSSEPFAHGWQPKIAWGVGLLAGAAIGFAMSALTAGPEADSGYIIIMSAIFGAGTAGTILEWKRTLLAEYLFEIPLFGWAVVVVGTTQGKYPIFPVALLGGAACVSAVVAAGFFIRWRRWIKSLPESVTMEQE